MDSRETETRAEIRVSTNGYDNKGDPLLLVESVSGEIAVNNEEEIYSNG